ncbi:MAG: ATP phosphoribosyltransferase regulatory subunit, partial [Clostridia bacterium]|nr:ATP phosphoribosyltransferase regulatory subunit [Clostridia bacterium]
MNINDSVFKRDERAIFRLRTLYRRYGYAPYKMSKFEEYDLYVRNKSFLVSDNVITFTDTNGKLMALKPDVTLSIVKNSKDTAGQVQKVYYNENVYRVSGGGHSFREIMQVGAECLGEVDSYCIAEMLTMAVESLREISPDFILDVSHLGIVSAVLDSMGVSKEAEQRLLTCIGEKNLHGIGEICAAEGVSVEKRQALEHLITTYGDEKTVLKKLRAVLGAEAEVAALDQLEEIFAAVPSEWKQSRIRIDFSVVGDMSYYNGIVFKGFINGIPSSILSGGQYDRLMRRMGKRSGAIGFAVYLDLLDELSREGNEYDVDVILTYGAGASAATVAGAVRRLNEDGKRVMAVRAIPEKITYREHWILKGEEV